MTIEQRQKAHLEFMGAAIKAVMLLQPDSKYVTLEAPAVAEYALSVADEALLYYEARWKGEEV